MKCPGANHPAGAGAGQGHGDRCGDIDSMTYNCPGSRHIHTPHHSHYHVVIHLAATTELILISIRRCYSLNQIVYVDFPNNILTPNIGL